MPKLLFQPDFINGSEFYPMAIDIHLGLIKNPAEEILNDHTVNNIDTEIVDSDRAEVLDWLQKQFARKFETYVKVKESEIKSVDYDTKEA